MQRQRGELVPIGEVVADLDGPVKAIREASPQARHHFTQADQVNQLVSASEADPDLGFMARLLALCSLPRTNPGNRKEYKRVNGPYTLYMQSGPGNKLPFGNLPAPARLHPPSRRWAGGGSTHGKMREVICSRSLRGSIQFSRRQGGEYGIGFEIKRQADDGLRGGDFDRAGKAGGTIGSRGAGQVSSTILVR